KRGSAGRMDNLESQLRQLIVTTLRLRDLSSESIAVDTPLFHAGLGLDSIDAFELMVAIHRTFGVRLRIDDEDSRNVLRTVGTLATFLRSKGVNAEQSRHE